MRKAMAIQALGYPILLALIYEWLGIGDRSFGQVLLSALVGAAIVFGAVWLFGKALAPGFPLRRWPRFLLWVLAVIVVIGIAVWLDGYRARAGLSIASRLTLWFRRPVKPQTISSIYGALVWIAAGAGVTAILPFASASAEGAVKGARSALGEWRYWVGCAVLIAAGYWLPGLLIGWAPKLTGFAAQTASLAARFIAAYAIGLACWLEIAWLARRYRPAATA